VNKIQKLPLYFAFLFIFCFQIWKLPIISGDTVALFSSADNLKACVMSIQLNKCDGVIQFGYTQHLIALVLGSKFNDISNRLTAYSILNLSMFWLLVYSVLRLKINPLIKLFLSSLFLLSPLLAYSIETFSEMSNTVLILLLILLLYSKSRLVIIFFVSYFASGYRENSFLLTSSIILIAYLIDKKEQRNFKKLLVLLSSAFFGIITLLCFNYYKNGSILNPVYGFDRFSVDSPFQFILNFIGLFFSPTGGTLGNFWLLAFPFIIIFPITLLNYYKEMKLIIYVWGILLIINLSFIALTRVPYGWVAFGPRYAMVIIIAFVFILFFIWQNVLGDSILIDRNIIVIKKVFRYFIYVYFPSLISVVVSLGWMANPNLYSQFDNEFIYQCPGIVYLDDPNYFECTNALAWLVKPLPIILIESIFVFNLSNFIPALIVLSLSIFGVTLFVKKRSLLIIFESESIKKNVSL
jgi:hypothetical protein